MTRQQRFERLAAAFWKANREEDEPALERASFGLAYYVARNAHRITVKSGTGGQETLDDVRARSRR